MTFTLTLKRSEVSGHAGAIHDADTEHGGQPGFSGRGGCNRVRGGGVAEPLLVAGLDCRNRAGRIRFGRDRSETRGGSPTSTPALRGDGGRRLLVSVWARPGLQKSAEPFLLTVGAPRR